MSNLKSLMQVLKCQKKVTILGHDNIDVDAFISGILLSNLLSFLKIENEFIILEEVHESETYNIVKELFGIDMKAYAFSKEESEDRLLFLEDHYKTEHKGKVLCCLDHHPTNDEIVKGYPFYYSRLSCSTSYMVYELMAEAKYEISKQEAKMILVCMMVDTVSFRSLKTVTKEAIEGRYIAEKYDLNYDYLEKYCMCLTKIAGDSINSIINNGYKYYNYGKNRVKSSYIQIYGMLKEEKIKACMQALIEGVKSENLSMWVFIVFECKTLITYEYRITKDKVEVFKKNKILSRGTNIMPEIEKLFTQ